eukprot:scaffold43348_cov35-Tisochrysis_lutea.AAC.2
MARRISMMRSEARGIPSGGGRDGSSQIDGAGSGRAMLHHYLIDRLGRTRRAHSCLPLVSHIRPAGVEGLRLDGSLEEEDEVGEGVAREGGKDLAHPLLAPRTPRLLHARPRQAHLELCQPRARPLRHRAAAASAARPLTHFTKNHRDSSFRLHP